MNISPTISKYLNKLKQNKEIVSTKTNKNIQLKDYIYGFKRWKESTTTAPLGRHLCHYHSLLSPYDNQCNKDKENFSDKMRKLYHSITSIDFFNESPLNRWFTSIFILVLKDIAQPQIHSLRIINTFESEYDIVLKYFWPKQGMKWAESNKLLGNNQTGRRMFKVQLKHQSSTNSLWKITDWPSSHCASIRIMQWITMIK